VAPDNKVVIHYLPIGRVKHIYYANLREMTDTAVSLLSQELSKRGMTVKDIGNDKPKILKLTVTRIHVTPINAPLYFTGMGCRATVHLSVETGDGHKRDYSTTNDASYPERACDGSISKVIANVLNDSSFIEYLKY
jgi:hypothetical protein